MAAPRFTVIIPTYSSQEYLAEAIASVYAQTSPDWELLVIDDGSDPPVEDRVRAVARDHRLRYFHQSNQGPGAARQRGAERARGEYLCYLDDDDYFLPEHLAVLDHAIRANDNRPALYKTGIIVVEKGKQPLHSTLYDNRTSALLQHWRYADSLFPYAIPRQIALVEPSVQYNYSEDFNWLGRLMLRLPVIQLPAYTVAYRWHQTNRTRAITDRDALEARVAAVRALYRVPGMAEAVPRSLYRKMITHQYLHWARQCLRAGRLVQAIYGGRLAVNYFTPRALTEYLYTIKVLLDGLRTGNNLRNSIFEYVNIQKQETWLRLRRPVVEWWLRRQNFHAEDTLLISATERSGSTWLMEILQQLPGVLPSFEPFHAQHGEVPAAFGWENKPVVTAASVTVDQETWIRDVLTLRTAPGWTTKYTSSKQVLTGRRVLIKAVKANLLLRWLITAVQFKYAPIVLIRHPLATTVSFRRSLGWPAAASDAERWSENPQTRHYYEHRQYYTSLTTDLERRVAYWCIENRAVLSDATIRAHCITVYYEYLLLDPAREIDRILKRWNLTDVPPSVVTQLRYDRPSATTYRDDLRDLPEEQLRKAWQLTTAREREQVQAVLNHFGVTLYHCDDPMPQLTPSDHARPT